MKSYLKQRISSDKYLDSFKEILRRNSMHFLSMEVSSDEKDTQEATDMIVKIEGGDVALRVREPSCKYRDLTIRTRSRSGGKTEAHKIYDGFGDWYLYGWGDGHKTVLEYILVDLNRVRKFKLLNANRPQISNGDGTKFFSIPIGELEMAGCIVSKLLKESTQHVVDDYIMERIQKNDHYQQQSIDG